MAAKELSGWSPVQRAEVADLAQRLLAALAAEDDGAAGQHILALGKYAELFHRLGEMTRDLHNRLQSFLQDSTLMALAEQGSSDTRQRLDQVISLTDDAAHKTLDAVEQIREQLAQPALQTAQASAVVRAIREQLESITLAQGYQDLSGQLIGRAISMIGDMEQQLVALLRLLADDVKDVVPLAATGKAEPDWARGQGPKVAGTETGDYLSNQDEVDDLLKSLGF